MPSLLVVFPLHRGDHILAFPGQFRMLGVVALHVAAAAAAGGVDACFDGWGREAAFGGIVDRWADVPYFSPWR